MSLVIVLLAVFLSAATSHAQTRPTTSSESSVESQAVARTRPAAAADENNGLDWSRLTMAMVVVLGLIVALKYVATWLFPGARVGGGGRGVRVLARTAIAPRQQVLLLQVGRRVLVVGDSGGTMSALANIDEPDEVAELLGQMSQTTPASASSRFKALFGRAERDFDEPSPESLTAADDTEARYPPGRANRSTATERDDEADSNVEPVTDPGLAAAQSEMSGLLDRMRSLSKSVKRP